MVRFVVKSVVVAGVASLLGVGLGAHVGVAVTPSVRDVTVSPSSVVFPSTVATQSSPVVPVTVTSSGNLPVTVTGFRIVGDSSQATPFKVAWSQCGSLLPPGKSCTAGVVFSPTTGGRVDAVLRPVLGESDTKASAVLVGVGVSAVRDVTVSPSSVVFPSTVATQSSPVVPVTVTSSGNLPVTVTGFRIVGDSSQATPFKVVWSQCGGLLPPGKSCTVGVQFAPQGEGSMSAVLRPVLGESDTKASASLQGEGVRAVRDVTVSPFKVVFPKTAVGQSSPVVPVTVTSSGNLPVTVRAVSTSSDGTRLSPFKVVWSQCGQLLTPGKSCTVGVVFRPVTVGRVSAVLRPVLGESDTKAFAAVQGEGVRASFLR